MMLRILNAALVALKECLDEKRAFCWISTHTQVRCPLF